MPRRAVWPYIDGMGERKIIEIERDRGDPKRRRMRVTGGEWTEWTARESPLRRVVNLEKPMNVNGEALKRFVDQIEASRAKQKEEAKHQSEIFRQAKAALLEPKALRAVLQRRSMDPTRRDEMDYYVHSYELALGNKAVALEALESGKSIREAAEISGLSVATVERMSALKNSVVRVETRIGPEKASA